MNETSQAPNRPFPIDARRSACVLGVALILRATSAISAHTDADMHCTNASVSAAKACAGDARSTYNLTKGKCYNLPTVSGIKSCIKEAHSTRGEDLDDCNAQLDARLELCSRIGEAAYVPDVTPSNFTTTIDNPFLPWTPGTVFTYANTNGEDVTVEVLSDTTTIDGVEVRIVHDVGAMDGVLHEDTYDYYAQDTAGNVWYFGEDTQQFDETGRLLGIEGAWRAGEEGAQPGIVQEAISQVGDLYRQEYLLGVAEDQAEVVSTNATATVPFGGTYSNCLETEETNALEPDGLEHKFYASGIGLVLTVDEENGDREELTGITP